MTTHTIRPVRLLAVVTITGALLAGAHASSASTTDTSTGCHGLSPASAQGCAADVFVP